MGAGQPPAYHHGALAGGSSLRWAERPAVGLTWVNRAVRIVWFATIVAMVAGLIPLAFQTIVLLAVVVSGLALMRWADLNLKPIVTGSFRDPPILDSLSAARRAGKRLAWAMGVTLAWVLAFPLITDGVDATVPPPSEIMFNHGQYDLRKTLVVSTLMQRHQWPLREVGTGWSPVLPYKVYLARGTNTAGGSGSSIWLPDRDRIAIYDYIGGCGGV